MTEPSSLALAHRRVIDAARQIERLSLYVRDAHEEYEKASKELREARARAERARGTLVT